MAKSTFLQDFKAFAMKGNVIDMAVGVIIGGAFGKIVTSVVNDLIMPTVGMLVGGVNFTDLKLTMKEAVPEKLNEAGEVIEAAVPAVTLNYGNFLQQTFDFLIIAFCIFLMVKGIAKLNNMKKKEEEAPAEPTPAPAPEPSAEEKLLTEIRDLLKNKQ
ncbi:MAG: large-conductance mechanosensitive channel protein MscL [Bacteroidaceae bacterium]|mgnify:FL=1|nr:large-conductance mechanosensitive channel protein MscL [Bacteroidaceae bacterium]MEE0119670.1 large-conductance mechanosensitive channel protein MscL [Bacteroidaceae bacterium]